MPEIPIPPEFRRAAWSEVESGQAIWYTASGSRPMGPWIVVDPKRRLIRPLNSDVRRTLKLEEILIRPGLPPPKPEK